MADEPALPQFFSGVEILLYITPPFPSLDQEDSINII